MRLTSGEPNGAPIDHRLDAIELLRTEAGLLLTCASQEAARQLLQSAVRDLDEAETWVRSLEGPDCPPIIGLIDLLMELAATRVQVVAEAVRAYGPDAPRIGG
jgi:hypothetical protein